MLTIDTPDGAEVVLSELVDAFAADAAVALMSTQGELSGLHLHVRERRTERRHPPWAPVGSSGVWSSSDDVEGHRVHPMRAMPGSDLRASLECIPIE